MATPDGYAGTAGAYDLFDTGARAAQVSALGRLLPLLRTDAGPVLDVGSGTGLVTGMLLERCPEVRVVGLEPSPTMRALAFARVAARPEWFDRVTIRPEDFFSATLPPRIGGALLLGVLGHFDPGERAAVFAELADRLPAGGGGLLDLPAPERPGRVPAYEVEVARIGDLSYRGVFEAWPLDTELMRWRITFLTLEGERVLVEEIAEHHYRHPAPAVVVAEAAQVGLRMERVGDLSHWVFTRA